MPFNLIGDAFTAFSSAFGNEAQNNAFASVWLPHVETVRALVQQEQRDPAIVEAMNAPITDPGPTAEELRIREMQEAGFGQVPPEVIQQGPLGTAAGVIRRRIGLPGPGVVGRIILNPQEIGSEQIPRFFSIKGMGRPNSPSFVCRSK